MKRLIFLVERDYSLRANISELLELEGWEVRNLTTKGIYSAFKNYRPGIVIINHLTLNVPTEEMISFLYNKVDGIVILCTDIENPRFLGADLKIQLPFDHQKFAEQLADFQNGSVLTKQG